MGRRIRAIRRSIRPVNIRLDSIHPDSIHPDNIHPDNIHPDNIRRIIQSVYPVAFR
jgi:hypothetical protein